MSRISRIPSRVVSILLAAMMLVLSILACNAPTPTPSSVTSEPEQATAEPIGAWEGWGDYPLEVVDERQVAVSDVGVAEDNLPLRDIIDLASEQGFHSVSEEVTEVAFANGLRMWGLPLQNEAGDNRLLMEIIGPDGRRNAYLAEILEHGIVLQTREGRLVLEARSEQEFRWEVYDASGNLQGGSASVPTFTPIASSRSPGLCIPSAGGHTIGHPQQDVVTNWDEFMACMKGKAGAAVLIAGCASGLFWMKDACTIAIGTAGAFSAGCMAAFFAAVGMCGIAIPYCMVECVDDPPVCSMTDWTDTGRTRWTYYIDPEYRTAEGNPVSGYINAKIWCADMVCQDDRAGCCTYDPGKTICVTSGDLPTYALAFDKAGLATGVDYFPPAASNAERADIRKVNPEAEGAAPGPAPTPTRTPEPRPEPKQPENWRYTATGKFTKIPAVGDSDGVPRGDPNRVTIVFASSGGKVSVYAIFVAPPIGCMEMVSDEATGRVPIYDPATKLMYGVIASRFKDCTDANTDPGSAGIEFEATVETGKVTGWIGDASFEADILEAKAIE